MSPAAPSARLGSWTGAADSLLEGILPFRSPQGDAFALPGPRPSDNGPRVDAFEGYARSFLLAALRSVHAAAPRRSELLDRYAEGLVAGPATDGAWPRLDGLTQPMVEAAAIAVGLLVQPAFLDRVGLGGRERLAGYLRGIAGTPRPRGNWMWFRVMIETLLERLDGSGDLAIVDEHLDAILALRRGEGMWSDGGGARYDYYGSWAFSFYGALWTGIDGDRRPDVAAALRIQIERQRSTLLSLIDPEGRPVLQGRSLIYRAAIAAGLWAPRVIAGATTRDRDVESAVVATRLLDRVMASPALRDGILTLGWEREFLPLVQPYSGPASPLWIGKGFLGLLIDPDDPVWTEPPTGSGIPERTTIADAGWLLQRDELVRLHNHGTWRTDEERDPHSTRYLDDPLYARLAYSSVTAPVITGELSSEAPSALLPDNAVVIEDEDGASRTRRDVRPLALSPVAASSEWTPASRDRSWHPVRSTTVPFGDLEVRVHRLRLDRPSTVTLTGYALSGEEAPDDVSTAGWAAARARGVTSAIRSIGSGEPGLVVGPAGAWGPRALLPRVALRLPAGDHVVASLLALRQTPALPAWPFAIEVGPERIRIDGPDATLEVPLP